MNYTVKSIHAFEKQAKRLIKKYPSLKKELLSLIQSLKINPQQGKSLGKNCFKIRLSISSKGKGKSGSARIITHIVVSDFIVYLLTIYDKNELDNLSDDALNKLLNEIE